jgi:hypothetical protein
MYESSRRISTMSYSTDVSSPISIEAGTAPGVFTSR